MKKLLTLFVSLMLILSFSVFAFGCDDDKKSSSGGSGTISGNYKDPTDAQLEQVVESLNATTLFGDYEQAGWKFGLSASASFDVTIKMGEKNIDTDLDLSYKTLFENKETTDLAFTGKGSVDGTFKADAGMVDDVALNNKIKFKLYNDINYFYVDASESTGVVAPGEDTKIKISLSDILGSLGGNGMVPATYSETEEEVTTGISVDEIKAVLDKTGIKLQVDTSNGIKVKLSAGAESLKTIIGAIMTKAGAPAETINALSFSKSTVEFYFTIDKDGKFSQATAKIDVAAKITVSPEAPAFELTAKVTADIKTSTDAVTLPDLSDFVDVAQSDTAVPTV